ncbi:MAG: hypothetical protein LBB11_01035 [Puniceicoccales bacterium]|jgi:hypothetical protein|nr:hypothetical protein [Puniceicoccales bacterium]
MKSQISIITIMMASTMTESTNLVQAKTGPSKVNLVNLPSDSSDFWKGFSENDKKFLKKCFEEDFGTFETAIKQLCKDFIEKNEEYSKTELDFCGMKCSIEMEPSIGMKGKSKKKGTIITMKCGEDPENISFEFDQEKGLKEIRDKFNEYYNQNVPKLFGNFKNVLQEYRKFLTDILEAPNQEKKDIDQEEKNRKAKEWMKKINALYEKKPKIVQECFFLVFVKTFFNEKSWAKKIMANNWSKISLEEVKDLFETFKGIKNVDLDIRAEIIRNTIERLYDSKPSNKVKEHIQKTFKYMAHQVIVHWTVARFGLQKETVEKMFPKNIAIVSFDLCAKNVGGEIEPSSKDEMEGKIVGMSCEEAKIQDTNGEISFIKAIPNASSQAIPTVFITYNSEKPIKDVDLKLTSMTWRMSAAKTLLEKITIFQEAFIFLNEREPLLEQCAEFNKFFDIFMPTIQKIGPSIPGFIPKSHRKPELLCTALVPVAQAAGKSRAMLDGLRKFIKNAAEKIKTAMNSAEAEEVQSILLKTLQRK